MENEILKPKLYIASCSFGKKKSFVYSRTLEQIEAKMNAKEIN